MRRAFGGHAWDEVVLDGLWVPVDPTWTEIDLDAAHITLQRGEEGAATLETSGKLRFKVRELERAP